MSKKRDVVYRRRERCVRTARNAGRKDHDEKTESRVGRKHTHNPDHA